MGSIISEIFRPLLKKKEIKLVMLGLDAVGKTTILYRMKFGQVVNTIPTIGFNIEQVQCNNIKFTIYDVCGQSKIMPIWPLYLSGVQGLIFVIDSSDLARIQVAKAELMKLLSNKQLSQANVLILANKSDKGVMTVNEIEKILDLQKISQPWYIQSTSCAMNDNGLKKGFDWLVKQLNSK